MTFAKRVPRYAIRRLDSAASEPDPGEALLFDQDGLIVRSTWWESDNRVALADLDPRQSFALLGEPGIGKSTAIAGLVEDLAGVRHIDLDEIANVDLLRSRLQEPPSTSRHTVVLDGFDECPVPARALTRNLVAHVRNDPSCRIIVACRTSEWYPPLADELQEILGSFPVLELAPLSADEISDLASQRGFDGEDFLRAVRESGTGPLAGLPLTLDLLLGTFQTATGLPIEPRDIFEQGLRNLAEEPSPGRSTNSSAAGSGIERLAVAARISATMTLCDRQTVSMADAGGDETTLDLDALIGGTEPLVGGDVQVSGDLVRAAVSTAIFTGRGANGRLGVRHASFAAYLTARYLNDHQVPERQIRPLLTRTSVLGRTSVPTHLKEVAAWLTAMDPEQHGWLVHLDPDIAGAHATVVTDGTLRATVVDHLLNNPNERGLSRRGWRLQHAGLTDQLHTALTAPLDEDAGLHLGNLVARRAHTAVEIARYSGLVTAVPHLRRLVESAGLNPVLRASAANALAYLDLRSAQQSFRSILPEIIENPHHDPYDELRGLVLAHCWPEHLTVGQLLDAIRRPSRENFFGAYAMALSGLVQDSVETDILEIVVELFARRSTNTVRRAGRDRTLWLFGADASGRRLRKLATELLETSLESTAMDQHLPEVAWLMANVLVAHGEKVQLPARLIAPGATGLRRGLIKRALAFVEADRAPMLCWHWALSADAQGGQRRGGLLHGTDLRWLFDLAVDSTVGEQAEKLLSYLFDPSEPEQQELAWQYRDHPAFARTVGSFFEPIPLDSELADRLRENLRLYADGPPWEGAAAHAADLERAWQCSRAADSETFEDLCRLLWVEPDSGHGTFQHGEPEGWPSAAVLPFDRAAFDAAAAAFLRGHDPSSEEWMRAADRISWKALFGYVALREGARAVGAGAYLAELSNSVLERWAPVVLRYPYRSVPEEAGLHRDVAAEFAHRVPGTYLPAFVESAGLAIDGHRSMPRPIGIDIQDLVPYRDHLIQLTTRALGIFDQAVLELEIDADGPPGQELSNREVFARDNVQTLLELVQPLAKTAVVDVSFAGYKRLQTHRGRAFAAVAQLEASASSEQWRQIFEGLVTDVDLEKAFAQQCATSNSTSPWWTRLSEKDLADLAAWLLNRWGPKAGRISRSRPRDQIRDWRDAVLKELADRSTDDAVVLLAGLRDRYPKAAFLARLVDDAEARFQDMSWLGPTPTEFAALIRDARRTIVSDSDDLFWFVLASLDRLKNRLGDIGQLLWNHIPADKASDQPRGVRWRPKYEAALSALVADHLAAEIDRDLVVNREVLVRQAHATGQGLAVDVLVTVATGSSQAEVPIEIKGNWNPDLMNSIETQLVDDYLPALNTRRGVYVCGWFDPDGWDADDTRRNAARRLNKEDLDAELNRRAEALCNDGVRVASVLLEVPRPMTSRRTAQ